MWLGRRCGGMGIEMLDFRFWILDNRISKLDYLKNWKTITSEDDVRKIIDASVLKTQIIFKDSLSCGISAYAKERLADGSSLLAQKSEFNYLDLLQYRAVSNFISIEFGITHQSPQIIVIKDKKVVYRDSHHSIEPEKILKHL
jgi:bacillithiol system protein YtxJ